MATFAEAAGSGFHPVYTNNNDGDNNRSHSAMMMLVAIIFIVFIIFAIIIFFAFFARRDERHNDGNAEMLTPLMAATAMAQMPRYGGENAHMNAFEIRHDQRDDSRDNLKEFGYMREELKGVGWLLSREADRNHYETGRQIDRNNYDTLLGFKNTELQLCKDTQQVISGYERRFDDLERKIDIQERDRLRDELNKERFEKYGREWSDRTIHALKPPCPVPSIPVHAPTPYPYHQQAFCGDDRHYGYV